MEKQSLEIQKQQHLDTVARENYFCQATNDEQAVTEISMPTILYTTMYQNRMSIHNKN